MTDTRIANEPPRSIHTLVVRLTHWINAFAMVCMIGSGWQIYNASPIFSFKFPPELTLGGWLGGALAWHFAAMWLLVLNGIVYLAYGIASGHLRKSFLPLSLRVILQDAAAALAFRLMHSLGRYNAVQKSLYIGVLLLGVLVVLSGLSIWKPVQLQLLTALFGGYDFARVVHFAAMTGIVLFIIVHLTLVALVPTTLLPMITGRAPAPRREESHK
ncbi:MAG TPA: cytochrome b/b6 domain-containing protein [Parvibaculum sp.]|jgi:thiosulfate reductase cytochrome b subunit